jgi:hypothetical protein
VAARLTKIEKSILQSALEQVHSLGKGCGEGVSAAASPNFSVRIQ